MHLHFGGSTQRYDDFISYMDNIQQRKTKPGQRRVALTACLSLKAYDAIGELQRKHRRKTGKHIPIWKVLDAAIIAYGKRQGIQIGE